MSGDPSKWDGFSAFDSYAWDRRYRRGKYAAEDAARITILRLAIVCLALAFLLAGMLA